MKKKKKTKTKTKKIQKMMQENDAFLFDSFRFVSYAFMSEEMNRFFLNFTLSRETKLETKSSLSLCTRIMSTSSFHRLFSLSSSRSSLALRSLFVARFLL